MFAGKGGAYPNVEHKKGASVEEGVPGTNTLAYYKNP